VEPGHPRPPRDEQSPEYDEQHEGEVQDDRRIGKDSERHSATTSGEESLELTPYRGKDRGCRRAASEPQQSSVSHDTHDF
jgi:hypothetical protein